MSEVELDTLTGDFQVRGGRMLLASAWSLRTDIRRVCTPRCLPCPPALLSHRLPSPACPQVLRSDICMDVGKSLNPSIDIGQASAGWLPGGAPKLPCRAA